MSASRRPAAALLAVLGLAGCTHSGSDAESRSAANARSGEAVIERKAAVDAVWIAGNRVYGLPGRRHTLAAPVSTTLIGTLAPAALTDPARRILAYNSWRGRAPMIRLRDLATRKESLLDDGALSLAWRQDGALGYFKGLQPDVREVRRYVGHVVVRPSPGQPSVRWTSEAGRYVVAAWAGQRLLAYRLRAGWPDLVVLDAPGRVRVLARAGALVAVSPDGRRAFVATYGSSPPVVRVLDVAGGRTVASSTLGGGGIRWLTEAGSWSGEHVVATASAGLAVFRVHPGGITLAQVLRFPRGAFPTGVLEPRLGADGERVVARGELESSPRQALPRAVVLNCDRLRLRCVQGPPVSSALGPHLVYNPSRP
jgi:hypothetical protein